MELNKLRQQAEATFKTDGFPTTKEEAWRFTDVSPVANTDFSGEWQPADVDCKPLGKIAVVFENGRLSQEKSSFSDLPAGLCIGSILDLVDPRIGTLADDQSAFVAANSAYFGDGIFIEAKEGVVVEEPIHLIYLSDAEGAALHVRNFISCAKGAALTVVEEYVGREGTTYWSNSVTETFVEDGGDVDHYKIQRESQNAYHFQTIEAHIGANAKFSNHTLNLGSKLGRNDMRGKMAGEESEAVFNGLNLLNNAQFFDTHLFMDHAVPKCNSHELYKCILDGNARSVFCGRILVQQDAQQTDAIQNSRNLLLSRDAKIHTMPQLEIYADDVKCTHGATVGELDEVALYYLQTRGIDPKSAHAMLTFAFANEVLDEVKCATAKAYIEAFVHAWLDKVS